MRIQKTLLIIFGVLVGLPVLTLILVNTPPGRIALSKTATHVLHRETKFSGYLYPSSLWPPALHVSELTVANVGDAEYPHMVDIGVMNIGLQPRALLRGKMRVGRLALVDSAVHLARDEAGNANWSLSKAPPDQDKTLPSLSSIYLENSVLTYHDPAQQTDITMEASSQKGGLVYQGEGTHLGKQFSLEGHVASTCLTQHKKSCPLDVMLKVGHTLLKANGKLSMLVPPEGADFMLDIQGADASELFPLLGIGLPMTPPYQLKGHLTYENERWHFNDFAGKMGESDLSGNLEWDRAEDRPKLTASLLSNQLRFVDLGPLIGLAPERKISDEQKQLAAKQEASPYLIPNIPLDITRVSSMDAEVEFTGKKIISHDLPLDNFYLKLSLDDRLMKFTPLRFGTANGNISAEITINARETPVQNTADVSVNQLSLARILGNAGKSLGDIERATGTISGHAKLKGPGKSLHEMVGASDGVVGLTMEGGSISNLLIKLLSLDIAKSLGFLVAGDQPLAIRCFAASFDVNDGVMSTDRFVFDTADTTIAGEGTVKLSSEELALKIIPGPKNATLLSLRSPIDIGGTLKHPSISIEKGPLAARGGIAAGLATLAPVASVLAFIEPGMGKDSDCPALLDHVNEKTMPKK